MADNYRMYVRPFVKSLVDNHMDKNGVNAHLSAELVDDSDLHEFVCLVVNSDSIFDHLVDKVEDFVSCIKAAIKTGEQEEKSILSDLLIKQLAFSYLPMLQEYIDDVTEEVRTEWHLENGYTCSTDDQTGEQSWKRS
jgi:hypothetical protein